MNEIINNKDYKILNGNMLDMLQVIEKESIDAIVTDPPYGLTSITKRFGKENSAPSQYGKDGSFARLSKGFMGKEWDGSGIEYNVEAWRKCFDVLKDGGYLLAFGGTRTFHRIACAIEDAGFEIRDTIMWLYGSGFPKSHNISLSVDKKLGEENRGHRIAVANRHHPDGTLEPNGEQLEPYEAKTDEAKRWQGWGTTLKPAYEPIIVARKPMRTTVAENVMLYGVGGINIDECRVGNEAIVVNVSYKEEAQSDGWGTKKCITEKQIRGRFPANIIHDGSEEVVSGFPESEGGITKEKGGYGFCFDNTKRDSKPMADGYGDSGNASRFFYTAKASKKDRDEGLSAFDEVEIRGGGGRVEDGYNEDDDEEQRLKESARKYGAVKTKKRNIHPTVKPCELMQYLVRLVSPKGATILDPFMGSGSTGKACMFENRERNANYKFIGIDLDEKYCQLSSSRIDYALNKYEYDFNQELQVAKKQGQLNIFDIME